MNLNKTLKIKTTDAVIGHTRPDIKAVVDELIQLSPDWNRRLATGLRDRRLIREGREKWKNSSHL